MSNTQICTGKVRFSFVNIFQPRSNDDGTPGKYSITLLIPKKDKKTMDKINGAINAAKTKWLMSNAGKKLPADLKTTIHDGDGIRPSGEDFGPECAGCWVMTASSKNKPVIVDADKTPIFDASEVYSGCYGKAIINFYVYDNTGNRGVTAGLNGVMKVADGEPLSGAVITDADWDDDEEEGGLLD